MKIILPASSHGREQGWALLLVMTLAGCALMVLGSVMTWANENGNVTSRNNEYFATSYAAEAATEKVLASLSQQYQNYGFAVVSQNLSTYQTTLPNATDGSYWTNFQFSGGQTSNHIIVTNMATSQVIVMTAPYAGLNLVANTYEIIANAQNIYTRNKIVSTVGQQLYLGTIPLFQFAIFYQGDMEIAPGAPMTIGGTVHGNANIYMDPQSGLTFSNTVSAVGSNYLNQSPLDPSSRSTSTVVFDGYELNGVDPLNLPVGTNTTGAITNSTQNVYGILVPPVAGQTPNSSTGTNLLYNRADMIVMISNNNNISVTSGAGLNGQATIIPSNQWGSFISTNGTFYDQRDSLTVDPVTINVSNLINWSATNVLMRAALTLARGSGLADVQSVYVDDMRSTSNAVVTTNTTSTTTVSYPAAGTYQGAVTTNKNTHGTVTGYTYNANSGYSTNWNVSYQPGVVLTNGAVLPPQGLSIATPDPAYIVGNWNVKTNASASAPSDAGSADTSYTHPSAIYADAITILSSAWNPANSSASLSSRVAVSDTVNAAFLTGNVPSNGSSYSGGVENFPRFLESWSGQTFTYNGSMVAMFASQIANAPWPNTGTVYNPPTRAWAFDNNFTNPAKQPPMTPQVLTVQRSKWTLLTPYSSSF